MAVLAWLLAATGLVLTLRAARSATGRWAPAALAVAALLLGEFLSIPPTPREAMLFAIAALTLERAAAYRTTRPRWALLLAIAPALVVVLMRPGLPTLAKIVDVMFCTQHGALATSAVVWLGAAGLLWRAAGRERVLWLGSFALLVLAIAGGQQPQLTWRESLAVWGTAMPLLGVGLALLAKDVGAIVTRRPAPAVIALMLPLVVWNIMLVGVAQVGTLRIGEPVSFGRIGAAQAAALHEWVGHPLSAPANLVFSLRNRVAVRRFDLLGAAHVEGARALTVDVGSADDAVIVEGWHAAERDGNVTFRWAGRQASVLLPALSVAKVRIRVRLLPFVYPQFTGQAVRLRIGEREFGPVPVEPGWQWVQFDVDSRTFESVVTLTFTFDRATRPATVGASRDTRELSAAVDLIEILPVR